MAEKKKKPNAKKSGKAKTDTKPNAFTDFEEGMGKRMDSGLDISKEPTEYKKKVGGKKPKLNLRPTIITDMDYGMDKLRDKGFNPKGGGSPASSLALPPIDPNWKQQQKPKIFKAPPLPSTPTGPAPRPLPPKPAAGNLFSPPVSPASAPMKPSVTTQGPAPRPMGASMAPAAWMPGVQIDSGYDPTIGKPAYWKDEEEARYTDRAAENFEKRDWFESLSPQQKEDYLTRFRTQGSR